MKRLTRFAYLLVLILFMNTNSFAALVPIAAYQACTNGKLTAYYPIRNQTVFVDQLFYQTNKEGIFFLEEQKINNNSFVAYLADAKQTILAGCYSDVTGFSAQKVILKGLCPTSNCEIA